MSNEYFSESAEHSFELSEYLRRRTIIDMIRYEADNIIEGLDQERPQSGDIDEGLEHTLSGMRMIRLKELSNAVLALSETEYSHTAQIDFDESSFITEGVKAALRAMPPGFFLDYEDDLQEAVTIGARQGVDDMLELLVPDHITNIGARALYFFPWRKDALEAIGYPFSGGEDGSEEMIYVSRLSNIAIVHSYGSGRFSLPHVSARLIEKATEATPSSLPQ